jgi:ribosomal protein L35
MARQKTNKTAIKRIKLSNPKGNRKAKMMYKQSHQGHLRTKRSAKSKRRQDDDKIVYPANAKRLKRKVVNLK